MKGSTVRIQIIFKMIERLDVIRRTTCLQLTQIFQSDVRVPERHTRDSLHKILVWQDRPKVINEDTSLDSDKVYDRPHPHRLFPKIMKK